MICFIFKINPCTYAYQVQAAINNYERVSDLELKQKEFKKPQNGRLSMALLSNYNHLFMDYIKDGPKIKVGEDIVMFKGYKCNTILKWFLRGETLLEMHRAGCRYVTSRRVFWNAATFYS